MKLKLFIGLIVGVIGGILLIFALALFVWLYPERFITNERLERLASRYITEPQQLSWSDLKIEIDKPSFWQRGLRVSFADLCFDNNELKICGSGRFHSRLVFFPILRVDIEELILTHSELHIKAQERGMAERTEADKNEFSYNLIFDVFDRLRVRTIRRMEVNLSRLSTPDQNFELAQGFELSFTSDSIELQTDLGRTVPHLGPGFRHLVDGPAVLEIRLDRGRGNQILTEWKIDVFSIEMSGLRSLLQSFQQDIPPPFHVLSGAINLNFEGELPTSFEQFAASGQIEGDLESSAQAFVWTADVELKLQEDRGKWRLNLGSDVMVKTLHLQAPPLSVRGLPRIRSDERFFDSTEKSESKDPSTPSRFQLEYDLRIRTERVALISSEFARDPLPVSLDLRLQSDKRPNGYLSVEPSLLRLARRDIQLVSLRLDFSEQNEAIPIDSRLEVEHAGYQIQILIDGSVQSPRLRLTSEPPLSEDDIISVLLFGSPTEGLESEDLSSVGAFRGALVSRAMTLASLYFFIGTPIQSISYNPQTGALSARVRLPQGVAMQLGVTTDGDRQIGLRRRLGAGFFIETELTQVRTESRDSEVSAFLQWNKRY